MQDISHQQLDDTTLSVQLSTVLMLRTGRHQEEVMPRPISNALLHLVLKRLYITHMSMSGEAKLLGSSANQLHCLVEPALLELEAAAMHTKSAQQAHRIRR